MSEPTPIDAVNAWLDDERHQVVIALRRRGEEKYQTFSLTHADGDQLQGMLYLLTKPAADAGDLDRWKGS